MSDSQRVPLQERIAARLASGILSRPGLVAAVTLLLAVVSAFAASKWLHVNPNQLDLISQDLPQVKAVKRVVDMVGGTGHVIIALRGNDEQALKATADDLAAMLAADKENVRTLTYKISTDWVLRRAPLFMSTEDLVELRRRVMEKLRDSAKRASPFFFEITETKPVELKVDDLVEKYTKIGKKSIVDDYYISPDRKMLLLIVKPMWATTDVLKTGEFRDELRARLADYTAKNAKGVKLVEDYKGEPDADGKVVQFGFTGSYISSHDDEVLILESLGPVSTFAAVGIILVMLAFFRRRIGSVVFVVSGLAAGIAISFGFALASVGELNMITSILGGILMGTGIDFGIFLIYRLREELRASPSVPEAVRRTIVHAGPASFVSALGTGIAFLSLILSDFRGFSQFGLLAGVGVFTIGVVMYTWIPAVVLLVDRRFPGLIVRLIGDSKADAVEAAKPVGRIPAPFAIIAAVAAITLALGAFASKIVFDYDSRALVVEGQPSIVLQDEINRRMTISADPVAIYSKDLEGAKAIWDHFKNLREDQKATVDQVVSVYSFVPPADQQERNVKVLAEWKAELSDVDASLMPEDIQKHWAMAMEMLDAKPYTVNDIPALYRDQFTHLPQTKPENHGWLTFVYPRVDVWDGKQLIAFANQVEHVRTPQGDFIAAGSSMLFATLAQIVLKDARTFIFLTIVLLLGVLLLDTRSWKKTAIAMLPLVLGVGAMLGTMALLDRHLNFMNIVVFPIILGYAVSQGVYFIHRFDEGASPREALVSVGAAVACSTLTTLVGYAALMAAAHQGLKTMGVLACIGMVATLVVSFSIMPAVMQILDDKRRAKAGSGTPPEAGEDRKVA